MPTYYLKIQNAKALHTQKCNSEFNAGIHKATFLSSPPQIYNLATFNFLISKLNFSGIDGSVFLFLKPTGLIHSSPVNQEP